MSGEESREEKAKVQPTKTIIVHRDCDETHARISHRSHSTHTPRQKTMYKKKKKREILAQ